MKRLLVLYVSMSLLFLVSCQRIQDSGGQQDVDAMSSPTVVNEATGLTEFSEIVTKAAPVENRALRQYVYASAPVRGIREAIIRSGVAGTIEHIDFHLGDLVQKGQVLLTIDDSVTALTVEQFEGERDTRSRDLEVQKILFERGAVSLSDLTRAEVSLKNAEAQLASSAEMLADMKVKSPITGRIGYMDDTLVPGGTVSAGQVIARVVDTDRLKLTFSVGESQLFQVQKGASAVITVTTPYSTYEIEGNVSAISASSDESTGSWQVVVEADNPEPGIIRSGVTADIAIRNTHAPLEYIVPNAALVNRNGRTYIYVLESEKSAMLLEVEVRDSYGDYTAVEPIDSSIDLSGRNVIVTRLDTIRNGDTVIAR